MVRNLLGDGGGRLEASSGVQIGVDECRIDLGVGHPPPSLLPLRVVREAATARLCGTDVGLLSYGAHKGSLPFRETLASFLSDSYQAAVPPDHLFVTAGATQGLDLVCRALTRPGDVVFVEEPTYFCALLILADHGLRVVPVPTDEHGLVMEALEELLADYSPRLLYTIPVFHNPSGTTLPDDRRRRLVELSARKDFVIVADEVYQLLNYGFQPPPAMRAFDESDRVISLGAFSKILAPGLRLGWIQAAPAFCDRLGQAGIRVSGGGESPFTSEIVRTCIQTGLQREYLAQLKSTYASRANALATALREHLPESVSFREPQGGFFIWLRLPDGVDSSGLLEQAHAHGVGFRPGNIFSSKNALRDHLRVGFSFYAEEQLRTGAARLGRVLRSALR